MSRKHRALACCILVGLIALQFGFPTLPGASASSPGYREVMRLGRGGIKAAAWSPDGKTIAVGTFNGTWLYSDTLQDIKQLDVPQGEDDSVNGVVWSPDGKQLMTIDRNSKVNVWDAATWTRTSQLPEKVGKGSWNPDQTQIAVAQDDGDVAIWDRQKNAYILTYSGHNRTEAADNVTNRGVKPLVWSPRGDMIASFGDDSSSDAGQALQVWLAKSGKLVARMAGIDANLFSLSLAWSPDGTRLAGAINEDTVSVWDVITGKLVHTFKDGDEKALSSSYLAIAWSPDGTKLAAFKENQSVQIFNAKTLNRIGNYLPPGMDDRTLENYFGYSTIAWSPDGKRFLTAALGAVRVWNPDNGKVLATQYSHIGWANAVAWSPDGKFIASGHGDPQGNGGDDRVRVWDAASGKIVSACEQGGSMRVVAWSPDSKRVVFGGGDIRWSGSNQIVNAAKCDSPKEIVSGVVTLALKWSPDGKRIAVSTTGDAVVIQNAKTDDFITVNESTDDYPYTYDIAWNPQSTQIVTAGDRLALRIWDALTGKLIKTLLYEESSDQDYTPINAVAWSRDGKIIASAHDDSTIRLWDAATGKALNVFQLPTAELSNTQVMALSPDGSTIAVTGFDTKIRLLDTVSGKILAEIGGHEGTVTSLSWSPDSKHLASASLDCTIRIWEIDL